jgi:3',5'-cyclic-AMP phosphodiesterase
VLVPRRQVKAYVHGHTYRWGLEEHEGIHIVNTRAVAYVGRPLVDATG